MRNILIYISLAAVLFTACEDEYIAPDSLSDVTWASNVVPGSSSDRNQGEFISFIDMSVNALSHTWTIEEGNNYLKPGFTDKDSLPLFVDTEKGLETEDLAIHVLFNNPGINKIRLRNTFSEKVTWNGTVPLTSVYDENAGVWVIDTCLEIKVFATMQPACKIYKDEAMTELVCEVSEDAEVELSDSLSWPKVTIEAGQSLYFVDNTAIGDPTTRSWGFVGAKNGGSKDSIASAAFFRLGTFSGMSLSAIREKPFPEANVKKYIPLQVEVIKSNQPFVSSESIVEQEDETIKVGVTGELATVPQSHKAYFTVHVKNINGFNEDVDVVSIMRDKKDFTNLVLKLAKPIYNSDEITVAYNVTDTEPDPILSVDGRALKSFEKTTVSMYFAKSVCEQPEQMNFEMEDTDFDGADGWWAQTFGGKSMFYTSTTEMAFSGKKSLKVNIPQGTPGIKDPWIQTDEKGGPNAVRFAAGSYIFRWKVYIAPTSPRPILYNYVTVPWTGVEFNLATVEAGSWQTMSSKIFTFEDDIDCKMVVKLPNGAADTGEIKFYLDQFEILPIELRP